MQWHHNSPSFFRKHKKFYIPEYFNIVERNTYIFFLAIMVATSFLANDVLDFFGQRELSVFTLEVMKFWPKFALESNYLADARSELLGTYQLAQFIFPPISFGVTLLLYFLTCRGGELTGSPPFIWRNAGIPFVLLFAFLFTYLVLFNVMDFENGFIAARLYGTNLLIFWLPLTYVILVSIYLRLALLVTFLVSKKQSNSWESMD